MRVHEGAKEMICPFEMANVGLPVKSLQGHSSNQEDHIRTHKAELAGDNALNTGQTSGIQSNPRPPSAQWPNLVQLEATNANF